MGIERLPKGGGDQTTTSASRTTSRRNTERKDNKWAPAYKSLFVWIVDIKPLTRDSLVYLLKDLEPNWHITSFSYTHEMTKCADSNGSWTPGVVILVCRGATECISRVERDISTIRESLPCIPVVILSDYDDVGLVAACLRLGASGVITTSLDPQIIVRAIGLVAIGGTYIPSDTITGLIEQHQRQSSGHGLDLMPHLYDVAVGPRVTFTPRQWDVLRLLHQGLPNKSIAHVLQLRECSIKAHVRQLMQKLGARNRTQVAYHAAKIVGKEVLDRSM